MTLVQRLVLVGSGGLAREVVEAVQASNRVGAGPRTEVIGLLDDNQTLHGRRMGQAVVLGPRKLATAFDTGVTFLTTIASSRDPRRRLQLASALLPSDRWATVVHPSASVAVSTRIGPGSVLLAGVVTTADVEIGSHVVIMPGCVLTHDDAISDGVTLAAGVLLAGGVALGESCYVGTGARIREGVRVGPAAVIGMGAVVLEDVPGHEVWAGVPARRIARR